MIVPWRVELHVSNNTNDIRNSESEVSLVLVYLEFIGMFGLNMKPQKA